MGEPLHTAESYPVQSVRPTAFTIEREADSTVTTRLDRQHLPRAQPVSLTTGSQHRNAWK